MAKRVILSGMRPTGKLHLGNHIGALANWVKLQNEADTQCSCLGFVSAAPLPYKYQWTS